MSNILYSLDDDINPSINSILKEARKRVKKGKKWIQKATVKGEGKLRDFAEEHRLLNKDGTINLSKTARYDRNLKGQAKKLRKKEVALARTLRRVRK